MVKFAVWANFLHIFVYSGFFSKMRLINLRLCIFVSLKTGLALQLPTILLFSKYVGSYINEKKKSTVIPPNSRFLGLRKNRNREFGCLIKVPRVWRSQGLKSSERNRELENFASLEPRVCEVLLYMGHQHRGNQ